MLMSLKQKTLETPMNRWNIPDRLEQEVIERDRSCVYCGVVFGSPDGEVGNRPSWEHIVNDASKINRENIALCCRSCNSSKGTKSLEEWLDSIYCRRRGISRDTVATVVKEALLAKGINGARMNSN